MKKILVLLSTAGLIVSVSSTLASCGISGPLNNYTNQQKSLNDLNLEIDIDNWNANKVYLELTVAEKIAEIVKGAKMVIDYTIADIPYNSSGHPTRVGSYAVTAVEDSKLLKGSFNLLLIKEINTTNYYTKGIEPYGELIKTEIIAEIKQWNPDAVEGIDYEIITGKNGSWTIDSNPESLVKVHFSFDTFKPIIFPSNLTIDVDSPNAIKGLIEASVAKRIDSFAWGTKLNVDYTIAEIPYDVSGRPTKTGIYKVKVSEESKILGGGLMNIILTKEINTTNYYTSGLEPYGELIKTEIIAEIKQWNPEAVEGIDYEIITTEDGSWTIDSNPKSLVKIHFAFTLLKNI